MRLAPLASPEFNCWLEEQIRQLGRDCQAALGQSLWALVLGGGYGRGEGGVWLREGKEWPYNDLDLFLLVHRSPPRGCLKDLSQEYHRRLGVEVDFSRPYRPSELARWPGCQMYYDLVHGHQVLAGDIDWVRQTSTACWLHPPPLEASRLLLNRGAGLLWALRVEGGQSSAPDQDFVRRNLYKLWQSLGDALLLLYRQYQAPYSGREQRLARLLEKQTRLPDWPQEKYAESLRFRLGPNPSFARPHLEHLERASECWLSLFLHCEKVRLKGDWNHFEEYLADPRPREPRSWKNVLRNLRRGYWGLEAPRHRLYLELVSLFGRKAWREPAAEAWLDSWRRTP